MMKRVEVEKRARMNEEVNLKPSMLIDAQIVFRCPRDVRAGFGSFPPGPALVITSHNVSTSAFIRILSTSVQFFS